MAHAALDPRISKDGLASAPAGYLPVLPILFALRIPGDLQIWRIERRDHGRLASAPL